MEVDTLLFGGVFTAGVGCLCLLLFMSLPSAQVAATPPPDSAELAAPLDMKDLLCRRLQRLRYGQGLELGSLAIYGFVVVFIDTEFASFYTYFQCLYVKVATSAAAYTHL